MCSRANHNSRAGNFAPNKKDYNSGIESSINFKLKSSSLLQPDLYFGTMF